MKRAIAWVCSFAVAFIVTGTLRGGIQQVVGPRQGYEATARNLEPFIRHELEQKGIPAISIALVDDQNVVWAKGFGEADPAKHIPAEANTVYRVGSVSKLFTDIALMKLVEQGKLDLDAPVTKYLPEFHPNNPFGGDITLRMLTCHLSGLTREPPLGNYFDDTNPSLAATVASLNTTTLVYRPGSHTKYSNAGIAVLGYVLEKTQGESFYQYLKRAVLDPMGLNRSAFQPLPALQASLAKAFMWSYDGKFFEAPSFQLGMGPCGSMYTSVLDLARFESIMFNGGATSVGRQILKRQTLETMWQPQFAKPGQKTGFGIGFNVGELDGRRSVGHDGAIYGFATTLSMLPDDKLGVVVVSTLDAVNSVTDRIANAALRMMLAQRENRPLPQPALTSDLAPEEALRLSGRYVADSQRGFDLREYEGKLLIMPLQGGMQGEIRKAGNDLIVDSRLWFGPAVIPEQGNRLRIGDTTFARTQPEKPALPAAEWAGLIGEYGWDYNTLYILEKNGKLTALIEWFFEYPLERVSRAVYKFPSYGLYDGQEIRFERDRTGRATVAVASTVPFRRRELPGDSTSVSFRIKPVRPAAELRKEALSARPPPEAGDFRKPDLVELQTLDPTIRYEIRYATANNFMGTPFYSSAHAFLQRPAAEAVARASRQLRQLGFGLLVHDAYRPWYVTKMFWDGTPPDQHVFVAGPAQGSHHNRGCAVDLTLYDLKTGAAVKMTGGYDEMSERSYAGYPGGTSLERWHRDLLRNYMEAEGFNVYEFEWWHFDYKDWKQYPILNVTFEQLGRKR